MSEKDIKQELSNTILVKNLPPDATVDQITECFSSYGNVMACSLCTLSYMNTYYSFQMCYVKFDCNDPIIDLLENDIDVILDGFYLIIESAVDNKLIWNSVVILGIGVSTKKEQVEEALEQFNSPKITKFQEAVVSDNGFCIAEFPSSSFVKACLECQSNIKICQIPCAIRPFPHPIFHFVRISPTPVVFQSLRGVEQFDDFTFITPEGPYKCSSMVAAFSCSVVRKIVEKNSSKSELKIEIPGDFKIILDSIYGLHVRITKDICNYVYKVASFLGYDDLRRVASLVCYELLTPQDVVKEYTLMLKSGFPCDYIIEFIATHVKTIPDLSSLPRNALTTIFRHPIFKSMSQEDINALMNQLPRIRSILSSELMNASSIENDRTFILQKLDNLEEIMAKAEQVHQNMQISKTKSNIVSQKQEEIPIVQMHDDDREQMRRNMFVVADRNPISFFGDNDAIPEIIENSDSFDYMDQMDF